MSEQRATFKELIPLPRYGHSRLYERAALGVAILAVAVVGVSAASDDAGARTVAKQQGQHVFPVPANHTYGDGFGAGRGHQGQDILARCGKKVVAARGGTVQVSASHSAAGNYIVIDGQGTRWDYAYMHLKKRDLPREGARIGTGEVVGLLGRTGNATACNLHFEMWDPPGYYEGGKAKPPTKHLKSWDRYS